MSAALLVTNPLGPFLWIDWQATHATWFLAWLALMRPTWVGWVRWQTRQSLSASAGRSLAGGRIPAADIDSACLLPAPWQLSHALPSKPRFLSASTAW